MKKLIKKYSILLLLVGLQSCQTTYYMVRHAEKEISTTNPNPPLTEAGRLRAEKLNAMLLDKNIRAIYSTDYLRTRSTAQPLATKLQIPIQLYDPNKQADFIEMLKRSKRNSLIVGHSNTIWHIVNGLSEKDTLRANIDEREYGNLFKVVRKYGLVRENILEISSY